MTRVFSTFILTLTICASAASAQSGAIQSVEELKAEAFNKMFAYFEQMEEVKKNYVAACTQKVWGMANSSNKPYEADGLRIFYCDAKSKVDYCADGMTVSLRSPIWHQYLRRDVELYRHFGKRVDHTTYRGVIEKIDVDGKDFNGNRSYVNKHNDAMTFPLIDTGYFSAGVATLESLSHFYLVQMDMFHAERLKNGNLLGCFGGRGTAAVVHTVEFSTAHNHMPICIKVVVNENKEEVFSDLLKKGQVYSLTESTWVQNGEYWLPDTVNIKEFGASSKRLDVSEHQFEFVWKVGDDSPTKSLTPDSQDWMLPFFGLVINDDYSLRKGAQK